MRTCNSHGTTGTPNANSHVQFDSPVGLETLRWKASINYKFLGQYIITYYTLIESHACMLEQDVMIVYIQMSMRLRHGAIDTLALLNSTLFMHNNNFIIRMKYAWPFTALFI